MKKYELVTSEDLVTTKEELTTQEYDHDIDDVIINDYQNDTVVEVQTFATPETATEQVIESGIEVMLLIFVLFVLFLYQKYRTHPWIIKLHIDPQTLKSIMEKVVDKAKKPLSDAAIKEARKNNFKVDIIDKNFTKDEIKEIACNVKEKMKDNEQKIM